MTLLFRLECVRSSNYRSVDPTLYTEPCVQGTGKHSFSQEMEDVRSRTTKVRSLTNKTFIALENGLEKGRTLGVRS